jgi:hypothetical protein
MSSSNSTLDRSIQESCPTIFISVFSESPVGSIITLGITGTCGKYPVFFSGVFSFTDISKLGPLLEELSLELLLFFDEDFLL